MRSGQWRSRQLILNVYPINSGLSDGFSGLYGGRGSVVVGSAITYRQPAEYDDQDSGDQKLFLACEYAMPFDPVLHL